MSVDQGALSLLGMGSALPVTEAYEFVSTTLKGTEIITHTNGIRGKRDQNKHRMRTTRKTASGQIVLNPSATELDRLWPRMLGQTVTASTLWATDDTLPTFQVTIDKVSDVFDYNNCVVSRWTLSAASGQPITLTLDIEAEEETNTTATFPSISIDTDDMFVCSDITATIAGSAREFSSFTLSGDNNIDTERYFNSLTRSSLTPHDNSITLSLTMPQNGNLDLNGDGSGGAAGSIVITDGTSTYTFGTEIMVAQPVGSDVSGKSEIMLPLNFGLYGGDGASEYQLSVTKS